MGKVFLSENISLSISLKPFIISSRNLRTSKTFSCDFEQTLIVFHIAKNIGRQNSSLLSVTLIQCKLVKETINVKF